MDFITAAVPEHWFFVLTFLYGLIIGSFLNVVIYRFHTGKSLSGHSHCLSCGTKLRWFDLFPLFSYLALRGRCRVCGCGIPSRYFVVELATGALFLLAAIVAGSLLELIYMWVILSVFVVIVVYDMRHFIIPDALTATVTAVSLGWMWYLWHSGELLGGAVITAMVAALCGVGFFYFLWFISKGTWIGFGDVKLAFPLGLIVGAPLVFTMVVFSFWIGAAVSLCLVGLSRLQRGKLSLRLGMRNLTIKSVVPFAPFLIAGCLVTWFTQLNVLTLFTFI